MKAPCKDCEKRHPNCHAHCDEYQAYNEDNIKRREAKRLENEIYAYKHNEHVNAMRKKRWRR